MKTSTAEDDALVELIEHPVSFAEVFLKHDLWETQSQILEDVYNHDRVAVKACHASSKTFTAAEAVLWWVTRWPDGIVITTAPTWTQVKQVLWREISKAAQGGSIKFPPIYSTQLDVDKNNFAIGLSTNESVRFQGYHGEHILVVMDEAPGVRPEIWEAIEGMRAGGQVKILALGNPTMIGGPFYDSFTKNRMLWKTHTISAFDTPNLEGLTLDDLRGWDIYDERLDKNVRTYLVTRRWVREKLIEWGEDHPLWHSRVLGNFPPQGDMALISLAWLEASAEREAEIDKDRKINVGIDVAGGGRNETAVYAQQGGNIVGFKAWNASDARGPVINYLRSFGKQLQWVCCDGDGMGHYFVQHLITEKFRVWPVKNGFEAYDKEAYSNMKAELYWGLRKRFEDNEINGLKDPTTTAQLASVMIKKWNEKGQMVLESKDDMDKRGVDSPDRADALMYAFAADVGRPRIL